MSEYDFVIEHRRGRSHLNADALSRRPCSESCTYCMKAEEKEKQKQDDSVETRSFQLEMPICSVDEAENVTELSTDNEEMCNDDRHVYNLLNNGILDVDILRTEQMKDEDLKRIIEFKEAGDRPEWSEISNLSTTFKYYWARWNVLHLRAGVLYRKWERFDGSKFD